MPRAQANKVYATFVKGLITEAGPLTFPENATTDELNCDLQITGNRKRRRGFNLETSSALSSQTVALSTWATYAINTATWDTVAGNGNTHFLVVQIGATLYFYDLSISVLSTAQKSFTVNLNTYAAPSATEIEKSVVQMDSGKGRLFVVGEKIESFYITYDPDLDTIAVTQIDIEIRDFDGVDDGLAPDEEPATLSDLHHYNLKNQGWVAPYTTGVNPVTHYFNTAGRYAANNKQWWQAKDSNDDFSPTIMQKFIAGNTLAPRGHYILKAFNEDRSDVSGVSNIPVVSTTNRPKTVAFFAGRLWYAGDLKGNIYFSQVLDNTASNSGKCYQQNDPTSEDLNDLLASDGGYIVIPEAGSVLSLFPTQNSIIIMANNGIWSISGGSGGFKATDFVVSKISGIGIDSANSVANVEGVPIWWGKTGINSLRQNDVTDRFEVVNLTQSTIQTFYDEIPALSKSNVKAGYDSATRKVYWLYTEEAPSEELNRYRFDRILILDIRLGAFYPWKISTLSSTPYYVGSVFSMPLLSNLAEEEFVVDGANSVIDGANTVVSTELALSGHTFFINFLTFKEGATNVQWTFGNFTSTSFFDWFNVNNTGVAFTSFFETGNELVGDVQRQKQAVYVHVYCNRTETAYTDETYTEWENPSGLYMQAKWEWTDHTNSGKFSPRMQVYRFVKTYTPSSGIDFNNGFPVVVTKNKIRGIGKCLRLRFESEEGKDFDCLGWAVSFIGETTV